MRTATSVAGGFCAAILALSALVAPAAAAPAAALAPATPALANPALTTPALAEQEVTPDALSVVVTGDGAMEWTKQAGPVAIQNFDSTGASGTTTPLPTEAAEGQFPFTLGIDRDQAGALQQSADHQVVTLGGYNAPVGADANDATAPETLRVIARVDAAGNVDTSTTLAGAYSKRHIRGVVTSDGQRYWTGGHGHDSAGAVRAGVLTIEQGGTTPVAVTTGGSVLNNTRVPVIYDGQLYVSSDRDGYHGINRVGAGLPTETAEMTLIAAAPNGSTVPHDFVFVGDHLYVAYTEGTPALVRYGFDGTTWVVEDQFPGQFWGLTGRVADDAVVLYATRGASQQNELVAIIDAPDAEPGAMASAPSEVLATAAPNTSFRGVDFAPGFVPGTGPAVITLTPTVTWNARVAGGVGNALSAVLGSTSNPVATGTISDPGADDAAPATGLTVTATSADPSVVADENVSVELNADGSFALTAVPSGVGTTTITLTVTAADGRTADFPLQYAVSAPLADATASAHVGVADASAGYDVGDGHFLVADDDSNQIRLYGPTTGEPVAEFDVTGQMTRPTDRTFDLEAAARIGDTIYWVGSLGNSRSGNTWPHRDIVFATEVSGSGAATTLTFAGEATGFREALTAWDTSNAHGAGAGAFQFERATTPGNSAEGPNSLNLEGATFAPDGTTLWLGFRSPLVPVAVDPANDPAGTLALVIAVDNIQAVIADGAAIEISDYFTLDLGGRAIRDITETDDGNYLIAAGSADDSGNFAIFGWSGDPAEAPVQSEAPLALEGWSGSYETILGAPSLQDDVVVRVLQDAGTVDIYGTGVEAQDLTRELMKFPSHDYVLDFAGAFAPVDGGTGGGGENGGGTGGGTGAGGGGGTGSGSSAASGASRPRQLSQTGADGGQELLIAGLAGALVLLGAGVLGAAARTARRTIPAPARRESTVALAHDLGA